MADSICGSDRLRFVVECHCYRAGRNSRCVTVTVLENVMHLEAISYYEAVDGENSTYTPRTSSPPPHDRWEMRMFR